MNSLGCPRVYEAELRTRGGRRRVGRLTGITALSWERLLNGTSTASVTLSPRSRACAEALNAATPWAHELAIWRDADLVWEGPLLDVVDDGKTVTVTGRDVTAWLAKRLVHDEYDTEGDPVDVALIGERMLRDAFAPDDPDVLKYLWVTLAGATAERYVEAETVTADADLADLVGLGLDWTVLGRRIALFGRTGLGPIGALQGQHFTGPLPIAQLGAGAATRVIVQGGGVRGEAGGIHPVLGLLEALVGSATVESDEDAATAAAAATYTPTLVLGGGDVAVPLAPIAPVGIGQLVPGVTATVSGSGAALAVAGIDVQLTKLAVEWTPAGEVATPTFVETVDRTEL